MSRANPVRDECSPFRIPDREPGRLAALDELDEAIARDVGIILYRLTEYDGMAALDAIEALREWWRARIEMSVDLGVVMWVAWA